MQKHFVAVAAAAGFASLFSGSAEPQQPNPPTNLCMDDQCDKAANATASEAPRERIFKDVPQMRESRIPERPTSDLDRIEFAMSVEEFLEKNPINVYTQDGIPPREWTLQENKIREALHELEKVGTTGNIDLEEVRTYFAIKNAKDVTKKIFAGKMPRAGIGFLIGLSNQTDEDGKKSIAETVVETGAKAIFDSARKTGMGLLLKIEKPIVMADGTLTSEFFVKKLKASLEQEWERYNAVRWGDHVLSPMRIDDEVRYQMKEAEYDGPRFEPSR